MNTVTRKQLIDFNNTLHDTANLPGVKFAYANSKNRKKLKPEMQSLVDAQKSDEDFIKFETELKTLVEKHAERDEAGELKLIKNNAGETGYQVAEDNEEFKKAHEKLRKKHKAAIDKDEAKKAEYNNLLDEEVDLAKFDFHKVKPEELPQQMNSIHIDDLELMIE